jgi:cytochrome P450
MISLISGRIFVGPELNRDEQWVQANIDFTLDLFRGGEQVKKLPYYLRNPAIKLGLLDKVNNIHSFEKYAMRHLIPILKERMRQQSKDGSVKPRDMMQWIMEYGREMKPPLTLEQQAKTQLVLGMSAIHASSIATINLIYDLVARPKYMEPLREEVDRIWEETNGVLDKKAMSKLNKLDSFLKESQRLNPAAHSKHHQLSKQKIAC